MLYKCFVFGDKLLDPPPLPLNDGPGFQATARLLAKTAPMLSLQIRVKKLGSLLYNTPLHFLIFTFQNFYSRYLPLQVTDSTSKYLYNIYRMLGQEDAGPTLYKWYKNVLCLLGVMVTSHSNT